MQIILNPTLTLAMVAQESAAPASIRELSVFHVNRRVPRLAHREGGGEL